MFLLMYTWPVMASSETISAYTSIAGSRCMEHVDEATSGARTLSCPGVAGYRLHVIEDDERNSINIVTADERLFDLDFWDVITRGFSKLGRRAEWRIMRSAGTLTPIALIVTVNTIEMDSNGGTRRRAYFAVARIRADAACVVAKIPKSNPAAIREARNAADRPDLPCLPTLDQ